MLKQLKKLKANITIGQLVVTSQKHRQLLIYELNKSDFSPQATLEEMIASIMFSKGIITFSSKDLSPGGSVHNNALYLTVIYL